MADDVASITIELQDKASAGLDQVASGLQKVTGATGNLTGAQDTLTSQSQGLGGALDQLARQYTGVSLAGLGVTAGLLTLGTQAVGAASHLEGLENRARVVYGEAFPQMESRAQALAEALHRTTSEVLNFATGFSIIFNNFGITGTRAQDMSLRLSQLAVDISAFYRDISEDRAFQILQRAIEGNTRGLRELGISINSVDLQNEAFKEGITGSVSKMDAAQKSVLLTNIVFEKLAMVQGQAGKQSDTMNEQWKRLTATSETLLQTLGKPILPAVAAVLEGINNVISNDILFVQTAAKAWQDFITLLDFKFPILEKVFHVLGSIGSAIGSAAKAVVGVATTNASAPVDYRGTALKAQGFASGGIVDRPTYAMIGEAGYPEAVIPMPNGSSIPVQIQNQKPAAPQVTIGEVHVHDEADENRLVQKLTRMIQLQQLSSQ